MDEIKNKIEMEDEDDMEKGNPLTKFKVHLIVKNFRQLMKKMLKSFKKKKQKMKDLQGTDKFIIRFGISNNVDDT